MSSKLQSFVISWLWAGGGKTDNAAIGNQRRRKHKKKTVNETTEGGIKYQKDSEQKNMLWWTVYE